MNFEAIKYPMGEIPGRVSETQIPSTRDWIIEGYAKNVDFQKVLETGVDGLPSEIGIGPFFKWPLVNLERAIHRNLDSKLRSYAENLWNRATPVEKAVLSMVRRTLISVAGLAPK